MLPFRLEVSAHVFSLLLSARCSVLAVSGEGFISLYDLPRLTAKIRVEMKRIYLCSAMPECESLGFFGGYDEDRNFVDVRSISNLQKIRMIFLPETVHSLHLPPGRSEIVCGLLSGSVAFVNSGEESLGLRKKEHNNILSGIVSHLPSETLFTCSLDKSLRRWEGLGRGASIGQQFEDPLFSMLLSEEGDRIFVGSTWSLFVIDAKSLRKLRFLRSIDYRIFRVAWVGRKELVSCSMNSKIGFPLSGRKALSVHSNGIIDLCVRDRVVFCGGMDKFVSVSRVGDVCLVRASCPAIQRRISKRRKDGRHVPLAFLPREIQPKCRPQLF